MKNFIVLILLVGLIVGGITAIKSRHASLVNTTKIASSSPTPNCVPTFEDGDGPYYQLNAPFRTNLAPEEHRGTKLIISGKVLASDCQTPLQNIVLDIWQADEQGSYQNEWYRGQITVNNDGTYYFETVAPKGYGEGTGYRPPHIHFKVRQGNNLLITSEMFMPESLNQGINPAYILKIDEQEKNGQKFLTGYHDIIVP